jgi:hypothetical protein
VTTQASPQPGAAGPATTNADTFKAQITADAVVLTITQQEGIALGGWTFTASDGRRLLWSAVWPQWYPEQGLALRGTDLSADSRPIRVPMADWPQVADLLWEANKKVGLDWDVVPSTAADVPVSAIHAYSAGLSAAAVKWGHWKPDAPAPAPAPPKPRPEAFAGVVSATCESTLGGTARCGKPAAYRIHDTYGKPTRWWSCCATCRDVTSLRKDGLVVDWPPSAPKPLTARQQANEAGIDVAALEALYQGWAVGDLKAEIDREYASEKRHRAAACEATKIADEYAAIGRGIRWIAKIREEEGK